MSDNKFPGPNAAQAAAHFQTQIAKMTIPQLAAFLWDLDMLTNATLEKSQNDQFGLEDELTESVPAPWCTGAQKTQWARKMDQFNTLRLEDDDADELKDWLTDRATAGECISRTRVCDVLDGDGDAYSALTVRGAK